MFNPLQMNKIKKIFLVDDDELFNIIHKEILKKMKVAEEMVICLNGKDALSKLELLTASQFPELIFLDIDMPVMNGFDFLKEFGEKYGEEASKTRIFMLTSSYLQKDMDKANEYKISGYILKPLTKEKVIEAINKS